MVADRDNHMRKLEILSELDMYPSSGSSTINEILSMLEEFFFIR